MKLFINYGVPILLVLVCGQVGDKLFENQMLGSILGLLIAILYLSLVMHSDLLMMRGSKAIKKGDIEKGMALYDKAIKSKRLNIDYLIYAPYAYLRFGYEERCENALSIIEAKKNLTPIQKRTYLTTKGLYLWRTGKKEEAEAVFFEAHNLAKDTQTYSHIGFILLENKKFDEAYEMNKEAMEYNDNDASILDNMAMSHYYKDELDEAITLYEKIMEHGTNFPVIYYNYALCLKKAGKNEDAIENLEKALRYKFSYIASVSKEEVEKLLATLKGEN